MAKSEGNFGTRRAPGVPIRALWVAAAGLALCGLSLSLSTAQRPADAQPKAIEIYPSNADATCNEEFEAVANALQPGDELILHGGTYSQTCRRRISGRQGTPERPIVIRAAVRETPVLTRPVSPNHDYQHNNLEIEDSAYLVIRGLKLRGGSTGLRFVGTNSHITLEDIEISATGNNALAMNNGDTDGFVIRRNHIHDTGLLGTSAGTTEGEGMYVGCNDAKCIASNHIIEYNYIHHLRGTSDGGNDGIEVKPGSHGIVVRDNVVHDTNIGTKFPCIFVYGGGIARNIVERNVVWRCGEGIQVVSDVGVRNNVIMHSERGITAGPHVQVPKMKDVTIVNNTLYGHQECVRIRWETAERMVLANNAIYCPGTKAVDAAGLSGPGKQVFLNFVEGAVSAGLRDGIQFAPGGRAASVFTDVVARDFWPKPWSPLVGAALGRLAPENDFNGTRRAAPYDIGAYQTNGRPTNPGWRIGQGIKVGSVLTFP